MTKIEWCDDTINPMVGCSKCSPGCDHCYAEIMAARLAKNPLTAGKYAGVVDQDGWTGRISAADLTLFDRLPKRPKRVFVGSMTDLFHENADWEALAQVIGRMGYHHTLTRHTFMLLTKRPEAMFTFFEEYPELRRLPNIWLGVTVCNQDEANAKIPLLLSIPAAKRFVSIEPMLGPVDLTRIIPTNNSHNINFSWMDVLSANGQSKFGVWMGCPTLDWVICGGETGPGARPVNPGWVISLRDQCAYKKPFFFKSWGEWARADFGMPGPGLAGKPWHHFDHGISVCRVGKKKAGWLLDGNEYRYFPKGLGA